MSLSIVPGDHVLISLGSDSGRFVIDEIHFPLIYISPFTLPPDRNALVYINDQWRVNGAEDIDYDIKFLSIPISAATMSPSHVFPAAANGSSSMNPLKTSSGATELYEWPTTWEDFVHDKGTDFIQYARRREANVQRLKEQPTAFTAIEPEKIDKMKEREYPGNAAFEDLPEELVRHIARHDAVITGQESMDYYQLLRAIWNQYGPILRYADFFSIRPPPEHMCVLSREVPKLRGILPGWVGEVYDSAVQKYIGTGDLKCASSVYVCLETVRSNRGFENIQFWDEPPDRDLTDVAAELRAGQHNDRAAIVVEFDVGDLGGHVLSIVRLRDTTSEGNVLRDFICQSYVYQSSLMMEEIEDLPNYLERIAALKSETDPDKFHTEHERLFHARLSRMPKPEDWTMGPVARIVNGKMS